MSLKNFTLRNRQTVAITLCGIIGLTALALGLRGTFASNTNLLDKIKEANAILTIDPNPYTPASLSELESVLYAAEIVLNTQNPSDSEINKAVNNLTNSITRLKENASGGTPASESSG
jgi:hypothetical protein